MPVGDPARDDAEDSLAIQIVHAYEDFKNIKPRTAESPVIRHARSENEFVFGGFIDPEWFTRISASRLLQRDSGAMNDCRGRIVIIGGVWHSGGKNMGDPVESFASPVGFVPGLYLHANYVESLMDGRYTVEVSVWVAWLMDLLIGAALYLSFHAMEGTAGRSGVLVVFAIPLLGAYVAFANLVWYSGIHTPAGAMFPAFGVRTLHAAPPRIEGRCRGGGERTVAMPRQPQESQDEPPKNEN